MKIKDIPTKTNQKKLIEKLREICKKFSQKLKQRDKYLENEGQSKKHESPFHEVDIRRLGIPREIIKKIRREENKPQKN